MQEVLLDRNYCLMKILSFLLNQLLKSLTQY